MRMERWGAERDRGLFSTHLTPLRTVWDPEESSILINSHWVGDFNNPNTHHSWRVFVSVEKLQAMIEAVVAAAARGADESAATALASTLPQLLQLAEVGESWASYFYRLTPNASGDVDFTGTTGDGRRVRVLATWRDAISLTEEPQHLIVLKLRKQSAPREVYNGPGGEPWQRAGKPRKGHRRIALSELGALMQGVDDRVPSALG